MKNLRLSAFAMLALTGLSSSAMAQYNVPTFNLNVNSTEWLSVDLNGGSIPVATYSASRVRFNWSTTTLSASADANWALADQAATGGSSVNGTTFANRGSAPNSLGTTAPVSLDWPSLALDTSYAGGSPLHFYYRQNFPGSTGAWNAIQITLAGATPPPAPPTNDDCANSIAITTSPFVTPPIDIGGASNDPAGDPTFACTATVRRTIWYTFRPPTSGQYQISTCSADASGTTVPDTVVAVYTGDCGGPYTSVGCSDDSTACGTRANLIVTLDAATEYRIVAGRKGSDAALPAGESALSFSIAEYVPPVGAPNDDCSNAIVIPGATTAYTSAAVDVINATAVGEPVACVGYNASVWWKFTPTQGGSYTFSTCAADAPACNIGDTMISVWRGACGSLTSVACNDDNGASCTGTRGSTAAVLAAGTEYYIMVAKYGTIAPVAGTSTLQFAITNFQGGVTPPTPPANDDCANAVVVPPTSTSYLSPALDLSLATHPASEPTPSCQGNIPYTVWYRYVAPQTGDYTLSTCPVDAPACTIGDTVLSVYTGDCSSLTQVGCNDDNGLSCTGLRSSLRQRLNAGTTYYIMAAKYNTGITTATGTMQFAITNFTPPPSAPVNDDCAGAINVNTLPGFALPYTSSAYLMNGASANPLDPSFGCAGGTVVNYTMWYSFQPTATNDYFISTAGTEAPLCNVPDTIVSIFTTSTPASPCGGTWTSVACNDNGTGRARVRATLNAGTRYYFMVGRKGATALGLAETTYQFQISIAPPLPTCVGSEVEPNDGKATANAVTLANNQALCGNAVAESDYFKVKTATAAGITRYRLNLTSDTPAQTVSIAGLTQTAGVINAAEVQVQLSTATIPYVQWYGLGSTTDANDRNVYVRVLGTAATTSDYFLTLEAAPITPTDIAGGDLTAGSITITTVGTTGAGQTDTDMWLYDSSYNAIVDAGNDDTFNNTTLGSTLTRTLTAGTYYLALSQYNIANNLASPADDDFRLGNVLDFPSVLADSATRTTATNVSFTITDTAGTRNVDGSLASSFDVAFFKFTVGSGGTPSLRCQPADIAYGNGDPLPPFGAAGGFNPGVDGGDFDCFFNFYFEAAPTNAVCDIADGVGDPLPPFGPGTGFNPGVDGGDFDCFFNFYFNGCP